MKLRHLKMALNSIGYACHADATPKEVFRMVIAAMQAAGVSDENIATEMAYWVHLIEHQAEVERRQKETDQDEQNVHSATPACTREEV